MNSMRTSIQQENPNHVWDYWFHYYQSHHWVPLKDNNQVIVFTLSSHNYKCWISVINIIQYEQVWYTYKKI